MYTDSTQVWPALPLESWKGTYETLHMLTQMVGKVRMMLSPPVNHWWHTTLYVNARGLTTSLIPYENRAFEIRFDFIDHQLVIEMSEGAVRAIPLAPQAVADFYEEFTSGLKALGIDVHIWNMPCEVPDPTPFDQDRQHASYDPVLAQRFWRILLSVDSVFKEFRGRFIGKSSPVHFFWGSFDLACTRFSGRRAPERPGADPITREAYSHEVISAGFWPGGGDIAGPAFYAYAAPEPPGFREEAVRPAEASYNAGLGEFILMYDDMRRMPSPRAVLLDFLESTYDAGARLANWDRTALERRASAAG